jgi:hypothetical protein
MTWATVGSGQRLDLSPPLCDLRAMLRVGALVMVVAAGCYTQPVYSLNSYEQCAVSAMVLQSAGDNAGLYGQTSTVAPGENGGLYGASARQAPGDNGGLYGASSTVAPGENGGLYGATQRSDGQGVQCRQPTTPAERCAIVSLQASAHLKHQSNVGEIAPVTDDQVERVRASTYQACMSGAMAGPPGAAPPPPPPPQ